MLAALPEQHCLPETRQQDRSLTANLATMYAALALLKLYCMSISPPYFKQLQRAVPHRAAAASSGRTAGRTHHRGVWGLCFC